MTIEPKLLSAEELATARDHRLTPLERELLAHIFAIETRHTPKPMDPLLLRQCQLLVDRNEVACTETIADLLAHIAAQDQRIADLEAACQSVRSGGAEAVAAHDAQAARIAELESELLAMTEQSDSWRTQAKQLSKRVTQLEHVNLETVRITGNRQEATDRRAADLDLRLSIATELNVNDRKRIAELEKQNERFVSILSATETAAAMAETIDHLEAARSRIAELETGLREAILLLEGTTQCESQHHDFHDDPDWITAQRLRKLLPSEMK